MHSAKKNIKELHIGLQDAAKQLREIGSYVKYRNERKCEKAFRNSEKLAGVERTRTSPCWEERK
jgi:hypothetical protein